MSRSDDSTVDFRTVEELAEQYLQRRSAGESVTVDELVAQYPELADEIRDMLSAVSAVDLLAAKWKRGWQPDTLTSRPLPFDLGDYKVERVIGRGGMGVVYEAEHTGLQRRVAIKLLRGTTLDSESAATLFRREAKAAASLHHTNIVPVFDFGEIEGVAFLAMQLIDGGGLDNLIESMRTSHRREDVGRSASPTSERDERDRWKQVAEIGVQAASALHFAHEHGVIHRDIKPANLLLDREGVVWVADFGLARQVDATESRVLRGTPRYFAPERFSGRATAASDQFGLAATLYEMAVLQPETGKATGTAEVMRLILDGSFEKPRSIDPSVPQDLETIILKGLAREPESRFADCGELAADLQRFLDDRPIQSRPTPLIERVWRWSKRNPALAATSGASALLLVAAVAASLIGYTAERSQRQRAEATTAYAQEALSVVFDRYAADAEQQVGGFDVGVPAGMIVTDDTAAMLHALLPIFDKLARIEADTPDLRRDAVRARERVAEIYRRLGQYDEAVVAYEAALSGISQLAEIGEREKKLSVAEIQNRIGTCQRLLGRPDKADRSHQDALATLEQLASEHRLAPDVIVEEARTHYLLARRLRPGQSAVGGFAPGPAWRIEASDVSEGVDSNLEQRSGSEESVIADISFDQPHLRTAIERLSGLEPETAAKPAVRRLLAACLTETVSNHPTSQFDPRSDQSRAITILRGLVQEHPGNAEYRHALAATLAEINTMGPRPIESEELPIARQRLEESRDLGRRLVATHPYVTEYALTLIHTCNRLGHVLEHEANLDQTKAANAIYEAIAAYEQAGELQARLVARFPDAVAYRDWLREFESSIRRLEAGRSGRVHNR